MTFYKATLTTSDGFTLDQVTPFKEFFNKYENAYIVNEYGQSGNNSHLECVFKSDVTKTGNITRSLKRIYDDNKIPWVNSISVRVKKCTHLIGAIIYANKEIKQSDTKATVLVQRGWSSSWIDPQVKDNVKSIPHKMLNKQVTRVTKGTGGALMHEWCVANGYVVSNARDYLEVVEKMGDDKYAFGSIRHMSIYSDVMSAFGDGKGARDVAESELRFLL